MFKKPNSKSVTSAATTVGAFVVGAKLGDGIVAVMPESTSKYKKIALAVASIVLAASVNTNTTKGKIAQNALLGMGAKQLSDELTESLATAVPAKDNTTSTNRFMNALVGHKAEVPVIPLNGAWDNGYDSTGLGFDGSEWDRPAIEMNNTVSGI